jgi:hypothetical protein
VRVGVGLREEEEGVFVSVEKRVTRKTTAL